MEEKDFIKNFEKSLRKRNLNECISLYHDTKTPSSNTNFSAKDVILNISQQVKAMQTADSIKKVKNKNESIKYKRKDFVSVSMISEDQPSKVVQGNKFDTQCVSDTQLINIIEHAEALMSVKYVNRGLDRLSKCSQDQIEGKKALQMLQNSSSNMLEELNDNNMDFNKYDEKSKPEKVSHLDQNTCSLMVNITGSQKSSSDIIINNNQECSQRSISNNCRSPLVFGLESFEKFEAIAMPVVEENSDTSVAKQIINTQILSNQLYIKRRTEPVLIDRDKSLSPILSISKKSTDTNLKNNTITTIKNGIFTLEDSILFSSNEEDEIKNDELPLTCALTTSFYNEQDLNDTMYVGFQTASNKSIQVCSDSYNKAKSLLNDTDTDIAITKLVEVMDHSNNINIQKEVNENEVSICNKNYVFNSDVSNSQQNKNKSEIKVKKTNNICAIDNILDESTKVMASSDKEMNIYPNLSQYEAKNINLHKNNSENNLLSKETISDMPPLETDQLNIDDNIIKEFESNFMEEHDINPVNNNKKDNSVLKDMENKMSGTNSQSENKEIYVQMNGNGNCPNVKKIEEFKNTHKLDKVKDVFKDIDLTDIDIGLNDYKENSINYDIDKPSTSKLFIGFKTASNKTIKISDQALANTKKVFQDIENDDPAHVLKSISEKQENKVKMTKINEKLLKPLINEKNTLTDISNNNNSILNKELNSPTFVGFQTASNKPVAISKEALTKSKKIFHDIDKEIPMIDENYAKNINNKFKGFQTASSKAISISKDALEKSKKIFNDIEECDIDTQCVKEKHNFNNIEKFQGFKTASNKPVQISKESLARTKNIFQYINFNNDDVYDKPNNKIDQNINPKIEFGFQTASNKPVVIKEEALTKTKNIFKNIDNINITSNKNDSDIQNNFRGFKTAKNKTVKISEEALSKSKHIFQDIGKDEYFKPNSNKHKAKASFGGFKTGNSKPVAISETALIKSKELFKDIDDKMFKTESSSNYKSFSGFQTANNKKVEVSEKALLKSRKLFQDLNFNKEDETMKIDNNDSKFKKPLPDEVNDKNPHKIIKINNDNDINIEDIMNTEVIKDLEETLCTEDFYKEKSPTNKRSTSPILSCPRAKKRKKFEMPKFTKPELPVTNKDEQFSNNIFTFEPNYKKHKRLNLLNLKEIERQNESKSEVDSNISKYQFHTLLEFEFGGKRNEIDSDIWTTDKIEQVFIDSVNKRIIPKGWVKNHLKLIIWKLLSYEIVFPKIMKNVCTVKTVLNQLKYRYDRELYNVERPALRKILEKDEISSKRLILCVVGVYVDGSYVNSIANTTQNVELLLTDGWYTVMASTDVMINKLIIDGKINVGTKLVIHGAELVNCEQGVAPWEDTSTIRLKIFGNSIRRAKWNTRLGFHGNGAILSRLSSVQVEGGKVSRVKVFVTRVYPMLYVERFEDGSTVTRSERLENLYQIKYENEKQNQLEKLYEEMEKYSDKDSQDSESLDAERDLDSGTQLCKFMKRCKDPVEFRATLTNTQINMLQEHTTKKRDKRIEKLQRKVQEMVKKRGLDKNRNVVPLLKMRVADVDSQLNNNKAMITVWRPNESLLDLIKEGTWIEIFNIVPTSIRYSEIQLSAGRQSIFKKIKLKENHNLTSITEKLKRKHYTIKDLQNTIATDYNEIDTFGLIFLIEPETKEYESSKQLFQNVYLSDEYKNVIAINFWGGIKKFGFENILDTGQIISCVNLQRRYGNTKKCLPQFRATEFTYFTKTCKIDNLRLMTEELSRKFSSLDKKQFIEECLQVKNDFATLKYGNTEYSPYRLNKSEYNITKNKIFIDSPVNKYADGNLSGLDFESSFRDKDQNELSPKTMKRKRKVNEKIAKLEMYGEPPPLQPIHIINKSNIINNSYKSPLLGKDKNNVKSVASIKKLPENLSSPQCLNRTYVKNINPVKLNFSNNNEFEDPFAEEFDASPPLSLE